MRPAPAMCGCFGWYPRGITNRRTAQCATLQVVRRSTLSGMVKRVVGRQARGPGKSHQSIICTDKSQRRLVGAHQLLISQPGSCQVHGVVGSQRVLKCKVPGSADRRRAEGQNVIAIGHIVVEQPKEVV
jgi:hypothetical protein